MIIILHNEACKGIANYVNNDLIATFQHHISVELVLDTTICISPENVDWQDLLIVLYDGQPFSDKANAFVKEFLKNRPNTAMVLPVAVNKNYPVPPGAASDYKALAFDNDSSENRNQLIINFKYFGYT